MVADLDKIFPVEYVAHLEKQLQDERDMMIRN